MRKKKSNITPSRVVVYSAHDSSLIGLNCVLGLHVPKTIPPYGCTLKLEIYKTLNGNDNPSSRGKSKKFIRCVWNGASVNFIPDSSLSTDSDSNALIPVEQFLKRVKQFRESSFF